MGRRALFIASLYWLSSAVFFPFLPKRALDKKKPFSPLDFFPVDFLFSEFHFFAQGASRVRFAARLDGSGAGDAPDGA